MSISRDDFIAQMISALEGMKSTKSTENGAVGDEGELFGGFLPPKTLAAGEVLRKMCFDFPEVTGDELLLLSSGINALVEKSKVKKGTLQVKPMLISKEEFILPQKFVDNLVYLSGAPFCSESTFSNRDIARICASVFFTAPILILNSNLDDLWRIFMTDVMISSKESMDSSIRWDAIINKVNSFFTCIESSIVSGLIEGQGESSAPKGIIETEGHMNNLLLAIRSLGITLALGASASASAAPVMKSEMTLLQVLRYVQGLPSSSPPPFSSSDLDSGAVDAEGIVKVESPPTIEKDNRNSLASTLRVRLILVIRDLMCTHHYLIQSFLPKLLDELRPKTTSASASATAKDDFPSADECLYALVLSSICEVVTKAYTHAHMHSHASFVGFSSRHAMERTLQALECFIVQTIQTELPTVLSVISRMDDPRKGKDKKECLIDCEARTIFATIISAQLCAGIDPSHNPLMSTTQIYASIASSSFVTVASRHDLLFSSRAIHILVSSICLPLSHLSSITDTDDTTRVLIHILGVAALQSSSTMSFLSRLPQLPPFLSAFSHVSKFPFLLANTMHSQSPDSITSCKQVMTDISIELQCTMDSFDASAIVRSEEDASDSGGVETGSSSELISLEKEEKEKTHVRWPSGISDMFQFLLSISSFRMCLAKIKITQVAFGDDLTTWLIGLQSIITSNHPTKAYIDDGESASKGSDQVQGSRGQVDALRLSIKMLRDIIEGGAVGSKTD